MSQSTETGRSQRVEFIAPPKRSPLARAAWTVRGAIVARAPEQLRQTTSRRRLKLFGVGGLLLGFLILVLVPTAVTGYYYAFIASNVYVSEAKFAVRGSTEKLPSSSSAYSVMSNLTSMNSNQDAYIVTHYIQSLPLLEKLQREDDLRAAFSREGVDALARLEEGVSAERLKRYWNRMVSTSVDTLSGVVNLEVSAFTAADALAISKAVILASEELVNDISRRKRADAVRFSNEEVARAEERLRTARLALQEFRNDTGFLDPVKSAEATSKIVLALRSERIQIENEIATARRTLSEDSPSVQVLAARLAAMNAQIASLDRLLTDSGAAAGEFTASRVLSRYEGLQLEREFAEKFYITVLQLAESARIEADRQQLYLVTFVQPALAETAIYPRRIANVLVAFVCATAIWSILSLLVASVRDHDA